MNAYLSEYNGKASVTWIEDTIQFDFYDQTDAVERAADEMALHFASQDN